MKDSDFPEIPSAALRDNASDERIERIWRRLDADGSVARDKPRPMLWWAPAAVVIIFGAGVFVGARWFRIEPPAMALLPEPEVAIEPGARRGGGDEAAPARRTEQQPSEPRRPARAVVPVAPQEPELAPLLEASAAPLVLPPPPLAPAGPPEWQRLFDTGEFDAARRELERQGGFSAGFDAALGAASPEQAVNLADLAVRAGYRSRAIEALRRVVQNYESDPVAPLAAYKLGNLLEKMGDRAGASAAFAQYRRLSPTGDLAEDALARQVDVALERGDLELARRLTEQYAKDFPNGRRRAEFQSDLQKLAGSGSTPGDAGAGAEEVPAEEPVDDVRSPE